MPDHRIFSRCGVCDGDIARWSYSGWWHLDGWIDHQHEAAPVDEVPPFTPDPEIMSNAEGNKKILKRDQDSARAYLDKEDPNGSRAQTPPTEGGGQAQQR